MVKKSPKIRRTMIAKFIAMARRTMGKNNNDNSSLFSFRDARTCLGETSPEQEHFLDCENQDRSTCLYL